jgi:hypothetical protein
MIKQHMLLIGLALIFTQILSASNLALCDSVPHPKKRAYDAWLHSSVPKKKLFGSLHGVGDSTLLFKTRMPLDAGQTQQGYLDVPVSHIESILFRRKDAVAIGIGLVLGLGALGGIAGAALSPEDEFPLVTLFRVNVGMAIGMTFGMLIGFHKKKFTIKGDQQEFVKNKAQLQKFIQ